MSEPMWICDGCGDPDSDGAPLCSECESDLFWDDEGSDK